MVENKYLKKYNINKFYSFYYEEMIQQTLPLNKALCLFFFSNISIPARDIKVRIRKIVKQLQQNFWNSVSLTNKLRAICESTAPWHNPSFKREEDVVVSHLTFPPRPYSLYLTILFCIIYQNFLSLTSFYYTYYIKTSEKFLNIHLQNFKYSIAIQPFFLPFYSLSETCQITNYSKKYNSNRPLPLV